MSREQFETLVSQVAALGAELLALKTYVASIPTDVPIESVRKLLPPADDPRFTAKNVAAAHKTIDQLEVIARAFALARAGSAPH